MKSNIEARYMRKTAILTACLCCLQFLIAAKMTWWIPSGEGWKPPDEKRWHTVTFENEQVFVFVAAGIAELGPLQIGVTIKNKTDHEMTFNVSKVYLKDSRGFTTEAMTRGETYYGVAKGTGGYGARAAEISSSIAFKPIERLPPNSQKGGTVNFDREWLKRANATSVQLFLGDLTMNGEMISLPPITLTATRVELDKTGNVKAVTK